jgi:hypothetical protein
MVQANGHDTSVASGQSWADATSSMSANRHSGILLRAEELNRLQADVTRAFGEREVDPEPWHRAAEAFKIALAKFYEPFERASESLRDSDDELETAVQFLEADPRCHRSGYLRAKLLQRVAKWPARSRYQARLEDVVMLRLSKPEPGLFRPAARLAAELWNEGLQQRVHELRRTGTSAQRTAAQRLLTRVDELRD